MATKVDRLREDIPTPPPAICATPSTTLTDEDQPGNPADIYFSLNKKLELRSSKIAGIGLYAKEFIPKGEVLWSDNNYNKSKGVVHVDVIQTWTEEKRDWFLHWAYQISDTHYCGPCTDEEVAQDASVFQNHSCDPTSWFSGDYCITARRDIQPDEEITFDYATSETYGPWSTFQCHCGTLECRGTVTGDDYLLPEVQKKYEGHFISYIQEKIKKLSWANQFHQVIS